MGLRINSTKLARSALVIAMLAGCAWGCTSDDDDDDTPVAGSSGGGGASGSGSGGGTPVSGSGGAAGSRPGGSGGGGAPPMMIMCGAMTCTAVMGAAGTLPPCCDAKNGNACGATVDMMGGCVAIKQEGVADPTCPSANSAAGTTVPGCCKMGNKCGLMSGALMGCVERTQYPPMFIMGGMSLQAVMCGQAAADAGTE
jgi:hypothetical protein